MGADSIQTPRAGGHDAAATGTGGQQAEEFEDDVNVPDAWLELEFNDYTKIPRR